MASERSARSAPVLSFRILGQHVRVTCGDGSLAEVVLANFGSLAATRPGCPPDLEYVVTANPDGFSLACRGQPATVVPAIGELLFQLDKDITIALQERLPGLLFLHAAAVEHNGKAYLLAGESGHGKSTTAWGLLHHGFGYLSDELSPIELDSMQVLAYPHALCLKRRPPPAYPLPASGVWDLGSTFHLPVQVLPSPTVPGPCEMGAVFFVRYREDLHAPVVRSIGPAEAGARLYVAALNALAHPGRGLDAVVHIAERVPCFAVDCADLHLTCDVVSRMVMAPSHENRRSDHTATPESQNTP